jgi:RNA polymerase sigma factor (sigma-70 family)
MKNDATLLQEYARDRSEAAFTELVRRHVNFVYAAALRQLNGDAHLAHDVTQSVFTDLASKAGRLGGHQVLAGWLFTSTRYAAAKLVRTEQRRRTREQAAQLMDAEPDSVAAADWERLRPVLDVALADLKESDRAAILLRYLQGLDYAEVGERLALTDNAARMRTERALERLRERFARRGIMSTTAALAVALAGESALAAPAGLAATVTGTALAAAPAGAALVFMGLTKLQLGAASAVVLAGAGVGYLQEQTNRELRAGLRDGDAAVTRAQLVEQRTENLRLAAATQEAARLQVTEAEWAQLREAAATLQNQLQRDAHQAAQLEAAARQSAVREALPLSQLDRMPQATVRPAPVYPLAMREAKVAGSVVAEFVIDAQGNVRDAKVVRSTATDFEAPTLAALAQWKFAPGTKSGRAVNTRVTQMFQYQADDTPAPESANWF